SPSMSDSRTSMSALTICATRAARRSLSPNRISAVAIVSFSLTTGTAPRPSSCAKVARALRCRRRSSVSSRVKRICATVMRWRARLRPDRPHPPAPAARVPPSPACGGGLGCGPLRALPSRVDQRGVGGGLSGCFDRAGDGAEHLREAGAADSGQRQYWCAGPGGAAESAAFLLDRLGIDCVDLVDADDLGFVSQAMTVIGELTADRPVGADHVFFRAVDQMEDH